MPSSPSKVAINRYNRLPSIEGLTEKPAPISSGKPLKERVKICYRSDLYMAEQRKNVVLFQEQLRQALSDLKTAKPDSLQFHTSRVKELKVKADEMIIILQICGKINKELSYARNDLLKSVETGSESQLINKRRKRVQWLENRLEQIIIQHSPARKDENEEGVGSEVDFGNRYSDMRNNKSVLSSFPAADISRLQTAESNNRLDTAGTSASQLHISMNSPEEIIGANQSGNRLVLPEADLYSTTLHPQAAVQRSTHSKLSFKEPLEGGGRESEVSPFGDTVEGSTVYNVDDEEADDTSAHDYESHTDAKSMSQVSVVSSLFTDVTDEAARRTRRSNRKAETENKPKPTVPDELQLTREQSKVIVKSPVDRTSTTKEPYDASADDYWQSEHHRVEFSALRPYLNELDPNSLHQVAIAVPGNYVEKPSSGRQVRLPWRESEDNMDINREALDRLSKQLVQIQDKVYEAACKSVESMGSRLLTRASKRDFSSVAKTVARSGLSSRQPVPTTASMPALPEQVDEVDSYTPVMHLKYYSKEIPKAKTLPISRVNRDKCYPQSITSFVHPDPDIRPAPERMVNQGRLYNDTKLIIYKAPTRKRQEFKAEPKPIQVTQSTPALAPTNPTSSLSLRGASKMAYALGAIKTDVGDNFIQSDDCEAEAKSEKSHLRHIGLKWDRVQYLFQTSLKSKYTEERQDAAKQLGVLNCADEDVFQALKTAIIEDSDERVQYEAAKALIRLGCLEDELIQIMVDYLIVGNDEVRLDMLKTLCSTKDIAFINKQMPSFDELVQVLAHLCNKRDVDDQVSFHAAIAFGKICMKNSSAVDKMLHYLNNGDDTYKKAEALRILVKQFNESSWNLVEVVLKQFTSSPVWEHRKEAAQLLQHLGRKNACNTLEGEDIVYTTLERRLWDDSVEVVRLEAAHTLGVLDLYSRAAESVVKRLSHLDPTIRAHAVTSLGTLGIRQTKVLRVLTEMLELDPSDNVRREVIRAFGALQVTDKKIIRLLKEKERGDSILATEARLVLKTLESLST